MAKKTDDYNEIAGFLQAHIEACRDCEQEAEFAEKLAEYISRLENGEKDTECYVSVIHTIRGVMLVNRNEQVCIIAASCERAVRDVIRSLPNYLELTFYFNEVFGSVISEYISGEGRHSCKAKGFRKANADTMYRFSNGNGERFIGSKKDDVVAEFKKYTTLKSRIDTDHVVMEGFLMVNRSLKDNLQVEKVVYSEKLEEEQRKEIVKACEEKGISYYSVSQGIMAVMTTTNPVPEVICSVRVKACSEEELIISKDRNFFLILDGINNPDNLGMVLRTADASGVDAVILLSPSTHHFNKNAIRGGRGAVGRIPIYFCNDDFRLMEILHKNDFKIWGTSARFEASNFYDVCYSSGNIAVIVGNESNGVRKEILDKCTDYVKIPMVEGQSSLNIAVAAALVLYEYNREAYLRSV